MSKKNKTIKERIVHVSIIVIFVSLYVLISTISTLHSIEFFQLSNPRKMAIVIALAFELGAAASLCSLVILDKMNKTLVWSLFVTLTLIQSMSNAYFAYVHLENFQGWIELFGLMESNVIAQKRILSIISGAILPLIALGFIKSLVDYIRPSNNTESNEIIINENDDIKQKETNINEIIETNKEEIKEENVINTDNIEIENTKNENDDNELNIQQINDVDEKQINTNIETEKIKNEITEQINDAENEETEKNNDNIKQINTDVIDEKILHIEEDKIPENISDEKDDIKQTGNETIELIKDEEIVEPIINNVNATKVEEDIKNLYGEKELPKEIQNYFDNIQQNKGMMENGGIRV